MAVLSPLLAFLLLAPGTARACSCSGEPSDPDAVFVGAVVGEEGFVPSSPSVRWALWTFLRISFRGHRYRVHAKTSWVGLNHPDIIVVTGMGCASSGTALEVVLHEGESYLFRFGARQN